MQTEPISFGIPEVCLNSVCQPRGIPLRVTNESCRALAEMKPSKVEGKWQLYGQSWQAKAVQQNDRVESLYSLENRIEKFR